MEQENTSLLRSALSQLLKQDIATSVMDSSLNYTISGRLTAQYNELRETLASFSVSTNFSMGQNHLQMCGLKYRYLLASTLDEFIQTNADINVVSPDQMTFIQNLVLLGGKLQSFTQLLVTATKNANIFNKLREAAVLTELTGSDAIEFLRQTRETQSGNPTRSDIKELVTTNRLFADLVGIDTIINNIQVMIQNIEMRLVDSFVFYIFYGIPGTGKTAIAESIATRFSGGEFYKFDQSFFASTYLGVTESRIRNILETVRSNPNKNYTIIIDEADNIFGSSTLAAHLTSVKILLQTEISSHGSFGPNLIIIAITNYLDRIDQTFRRRATDVIEIEPPSNMDCLNFLESRLTFPNYTWPLDYKNNLLSGFKNEYIYTNSDMGRLAKNINDTFLSMIRVETNMMILLYEIEKIIIFTTINEALIDMQLSNNYIKFIGSYYNVRQQLADRLSSTNTNLLNYRKFFAPNIDVMKEAISQSSTLTKEFSQLYYKK